MLIQFIGLSTNPGRRSIHLAYQHGLQHLTKHHLNCNIFQLHHLRPKLPWLIALIVGFIFLMNHCLFQGHTRGSTTPGPVTTDFMESLDRTRSLLSEQQDQELACWQREQQQKNEEALQSLRDVSWSQQQLGQILQRMAANPSRQGTPITPTPAPLASPIHHPTPVPASPVSSVATIQ